ncbi:MAG TPA: glycosyltransferase [Chloroflexota bacterium]|nr:glycosyltransferase [Chloroflexota bacterium]
MTLSLCAIARDEERFLPALLESVRGLVDELVIGIDSRTTDDTLAVAQAYGARAFIFDWHDSFAEPLNLAIDRARTDWILRLDCDERLLPAGRVAIRETFSQTVPLAIDGFLTLMVETDLKDNELSAPEVSSARLFRNSPDLRYLGRIHEEVRYLPDPPRTNCEMLPGPSMPHIQHFGADPALRQGKAERDRCLLHLRLRDNPKDAVAYCYLALMARKDGRRLLARTFARRALECGPRTLHDDRVLLMQELAGEVHDYI